MNMPVRPHNLSERAEQAFYKVCEELDLNETIMGKIQHKYTEPHRYYHTLDHVIDIVDLIGQQSFDADTRDLMLTAAIFHDVFYDPKSSTNEEDSVVFMLDVMRDQESNDFLSKVVKLIEATKYSNLSNKMTVNEQLFCKFDLNGFEQSFQSVLEDEKKIRKEYEFVEWAVYQQSRPAVLKPFLESELLSVKAKQNIQFEIDFLLSHTPRIAVYPGSFDPFHVGHLNIMQKAEAIFDKVIIAVGNNPEKALKSRAYHQSICETLRYKQVDFYAGLLTDYIKGKPYPLTIIRGLRNFTDMQSETVQYRWLQELMPDIQLVSIFCDREFEHISSSGIKILQEYGNEEYQKFIVE
jgi:pantetheine-phosphate adenylyltransferase